MRVAGSCVAWGGDAVLLRGPSGSGKSDLCLRAIRQAKAQLVGDDFVDILAQDGRLEVKPALPGLLEIRGLGVVNIDHVSQAILRLVVDLAPDMPRMPEPCFTNFHDIQVPLLTLAPLHAAAPFRLHMALLTIGLNGFSADGVLHFEASS